MGYILPINHYGESQFRSRIEFRKRSSLTVQQTNKVEKIQFGPRNRTDEYSTGKGKRNRSTGFQFDRYI